MVSIKRLAVGLVAALVLFSCMGSVAADNTAYQVSCVLQRLGCGWMGSKWAAARARRSVVRCPALFGRPTPATCASWPRHASRAVRAVSRGAALGLPRGRERIAFVALSLPLSPSQPCPAAAPRHADLARMLCGWAVSPGRGAVVLTRRRAASRRVVGTSFPRPEPISSVSSASEPSSKPGSSRPALTVRSQWEAALQRRLGGPLRPQPVRQHVRFVLPGMSTRNTVHERSRRPTHRTRVQIDVSLVFITNVYALSGGCEARAATRVKQQSLLASPLTFSLSVALLQCEFYLALPSLQYADYCRSVLYNPVVRLDGSIQRSSDDQKRKISRRPLSSIHSRTLRRSSSRAAAACTPP